LNSKEIIKQKQIFHGMLKNKRGMVDKYGANAEKVAYGKSVKIAQKENKMNHKHDSRLKEIVKKSLSTSIKEKTKEVEENLGHALPEMETETVNTVKSELYKLYQNAIALYKLIEKNEKTDKLPNFPAWWQTKIALANDSVESAKSYIEFNINEPKIDTKIIDAADNATVDEGLPKGYFKKRFGIGGDEEELEEKHLTPAELKKKEEIVKSMKKTFKGPKPEMYAIATKQAKRLAEGKPWDEMIAKLEKQGHSRKEAEKIAGAINAAFVGKYKK
jgi:hypothetical protein